MKTSKLIIYANYLYFIICVLVGIGTQSFIQNHRPHVFWNSELSGSSDKLSSAQCLSLTVPLAPGWHAAQSVTFTLASGVLKTSSWSGGWLGGLTRLARSRAHVYDLLQQKDTKQNRQR